MGNSSNYFNRIILSLSPYSLIAYCAIFLVVRSETTRDYLNINGQSSIEEQLLGNVIDEGTLVREFYGCSGEKCDGMLKPAEVKNAAKSLNLDLTVEHTKKDERQVLREKRLDINSVVSDEDHFDSLFNEAVKTLTPIIEKIPDAICKEHSRIFLHQLRRYKMWALQMYDASAKIPSGILKGNTNQLGDYDQCLSVHAILDIVNDAEGDLAEKVHINGKYCLASVDVHASWPMNGTDSLDEAVSLSQSLGFLRSTSDDPGHFIPQFTTINWAVCLPSSCSSDNLEMILQNIVATKSGLMFNVKVDKNMCYVKEKKTISSSTYIAMFGFGFVIILAVVATVTERVENSGTGNQMYFGKLVRIISSFSLQRNWSSLVADLPPEGDIHCVHGIRAICTVMLYAAHKIMPVAFTPYSNRVVLTELSLESMSMVLRASLIYTDSFLLLSGVLTAYNLSKEMQRSKKIEWVKRLSARFIRLTPALISIVVFYAYILDHLGEGPLWNKVVTKNADICKANLWTNVLYIQNFFPFQQMCATHTHQLALDMQLSLLSPLLVYLLYKHQLFGLFTLIALHTATAALRYLVTLNNQLSLIIYHGMPLAQLYKTANLSYSLSAHRATPYLMGIGVGYFLYRYEKSIHIPKLALYFGWLFAGLCAYMSVFAPSHVASPDFVYDTNEAALYAGYSSITWSLALGWLICTCALGHGGVLDRVLGMKAMVFTSRISYSIYLTQFAVFFYNVGSLRSSQEFSILRAVSMEELFVVLVVSILMTLLFDLPMQELKGILTGSGTRSKVSSKET